MDIQDHDGQLQQNVHTWGHAKERNKMGSFQVSRSMLHTRIWYKKYWMNCFSSGLDVSNRWRSVPRSSVTKYLSVRKSIKRGKIVWCITDKSSSGEINTSLRLIIYERVKLRTFDEIKRVMVENSRSHVEYVSVASTRDRFSCWAPVCWRAS